MESLTAFLSLFFEEKNQLWTMFLSAFLSATVLPGNSEIIFSTLATKNLLAQRTFFSGELAWLIAIATLGNSLGSFVTYLMGRLLPKPLDVQNKTVRWALAKSEKYGVFVLLISSLPIVGDLLCGIAGWLRFNAWQVMLFITIGKFIRYGVLLVGLYPLVQFVF